MDLTFGTQEGRFNFRACAVVIKDGRLLCMRDEVAPYYYLLGGRVEIFETAEQAVLREILEECGTYATIIRPLWLAQSFFVEALKRQKYHEICIYYLINGVDFPSDNFYRKEGKHDFSFEWVPFDCLKEKYLKPEFIKREIFSLPDNLKFIYENEINKVEVQ